jgi:hypothetical protein
MQEIHNQAKLRKSKLNDCHRMTIFELTGNSNVWDDDWIPTDDDVLWLERKAFQLCDTLDKVRKNHYSPGGYNGFLPPVNHPDKSKPRYIPVTNLFCDSLIFVREDDIPSLHDNYCHDVVPSHWICEMMDAESENEEDCCVSPFSVDDDCDGDHDDSLERLHQGYKTTCLSGEVDDIYPKYHFTYTHSDQTGEVIDRYRILDRETDLGVNHSI